MHLFILFLRILTLTYTVFYIIFLIYTNILYMYIGVFLKKITITICVNFNSLIASILFFNTFVQKLGYSIHEYTLKSKFKFNVLYIPSIEFLL